MQTDHFIVFLFASPSYHTNLVSFAWNKSSRRADGWTRFASFLLWGAFVLYGRLGANERDRKARGVCPTRSATCDAQHFLLLHSFASEIFLDHHGLHCLSFIFCSFIGSLFCCSSASHSPPFPSPFRLVASLDRRGYHSGGVEGVHHDGWASHAACGAHLVGYGISRFRDAPSRPDGGGKGCFRAAAFSLPCEGTSIAGQ